MSTNRKMPMRQCVGCGEMKTKKDMMRVVKTADNEIILDFTGKKNGRGAYLCHSMECLEKAQKNKGLERSLKTPIPEDVFESIKGEFKNNENE